MTHSLSKYEKKFSIPKWSAEFAYALGLMTTDGNLSSDGRHMSFGSKDKELVELIKKCLRLQNSISTRKVGNKIRKKYYVIQFGGVELYRYFQSLGLMARKTKELYSIKVPDEFFFDFLRGHFDGDGSFYSYRDPRWKTSFCFFLNFAASSSEHVVWLRMKLTELLGVSGHISIDDKSGVHKLRFGKKESLVIVKEMYRRKGAPGLRRKQLKIAEALDTIGVRLY